MMNHSRIAFELFTLALSARFSQLVLVILMLVAAPVARAVEVLTVHELASHCHRLEAEPDGVDSQYCIRYIQGFIDGAVITDVTVMLGIETETQKGETFSERAKRTRAPSRLDQDRAAHLAGFCLGDPLPLRDVVSFVVADLVKLDLGETPQSPAREAVYESLRNHYACTDE